MPTRVDAMCRKRSVSASRVLARIERGSLRVRIALRPRIAGWDGGCTIHGSMDPLYKKAIAQGVAWMAVFVALIFLPAGTWHYWQGWLFIAVFSVSTIGFTVYLALYDRPILERRMNAGPAHEKEWSQKIIVGLREARHRTERCLPRRLRRRSPSAMKIRTRIGGHGNLIECFSQLLAIP